MVEISKVEYDKQLNEYQDYLMEFTTGYINKMFSQGIIKEVDAEQLKKYFSNPDMYQDEIDKLAQYFYITNAEIHTMYELIESLPRLNYRIDTFDKNKTTDKHMSNINKVLHKIKHKRLTRDLLKQTATTGTLVGMWLGDKTQPYPHVFDDVKYAFPVGRDNKGEWICLLDMSMFDNMNDYERKLQFNNLSPHVTEIDYNNYKADIKEHKYKSLPTERTFVLRTGVQKRNQATGTSWVTSGLMDVLHKKKMKDVEQSIANKVINAVAVLTVGSDKNNGENTNAKLPTAVKKKIHAGVKSALEKNNETGVTVVTIPDYANIDFPDVATDGIGGDKFNNVNSDIRAAYNMSGAMLNGEGTNFSSSKLNLEIFYDRLGVMLEDIEQEVYQKLFNIILPVNQKDNFYMTYDKEVPLTMKEKLDILSKLNDKGWSTKHLVDMIPNIEWQSYVDQTLHETEELKLQSRVVPYQSTHTMNSDGVTKPVNDNPDSENTIKSKTTGGNDLPS